MTDAEKKRFSELCREENQVHEHVGDGIGTYREKRLHRILKRLLTEASHGETEVPIGKYVADVLGEGGIVEIQTGSLRPLLPKLNDYLQATEHRITVVHPIIAEKQLIRSDRETGEILSSRRSSRRGRAEDILPELYWLSELLPCERICIWVLLIRAEEVRFSERRYRCREGAYDAELYPLECVGEVVLRDLADYAVFLPRGCESFDAAEYGRWSKLKNRKLYSALNALVSMGLLERISDGRKYRYVITQKEKEKRRCCI